MHSKKIRILTTAQFGSNFPENFSVWCAGALTAMGCRVQLIKLERLIPSYCTSKVKKEKRLETTFLNSGLLVCILPTYKNMFPSALESMLTQILPKGTSVVCQLVAIAIESYIQLPHIPLFLEHFCYPQDKFMEHFNPNYPTNPIKIEHSTDGSMCPLFQEAGTQLHAMIYQILHMQQKTPS